MPSPQEPLQATATEPANPPEPEYFETAGTPRWVLPGLGVLVVVLALVVFWLPGQIKPATPPTPSQPETSAVDSKPKSSPAASDKDSGPAATPWNDAQAAKLRKEAKDALEALLEVQFDLEERGVELWATADYGAALEVAKAGDELYRQHQYVEAKDKFQQALTALEAIAASIPEVMDTQLVQIAAAIEAGELEAAEQALAIAERLEAENAALPELRQRVAALPGVIEQLERAAAAETDGDLAAARAALQQAVELDPLHQRAAAELARVDAALAEVEFSDAMSAGYRALDGGDWGAARQQFKRAAGLRAGSSEAQAALAELAVAEQSGRLASLQRQGERQAAAEDWDAAVKTYQQALAVDDSVVFAHDGLPRARQRAALDQALQAVIDNPQRLSDVAVAESTATLLNEAGAVSDTGPKLRSQVATVEDLLEKANTVIPVTFSSDGQTEVLIYKVARLGTFQQRELELRPGSYRVRGSRVGYRDVLYTLEVSHDAPPPTLAVMCTEKIL